MTILVVCICLFLCACRKKAPDQVDQVEVSSDSIIEEPLQAEETKNVAPDLPKATSVSKSLYIATGKSRRMVVVDKYGRESSTYIIDADGNIAQTDGTVIIAEKNVSEYKSIRYMNFGGDIYELTAEGRVLSGTGALSPTQLYSNGVLELYCSPENATNKVVCIRSDSPSVIEIRPNGNANFASLPDGILTEGEIALEAVDLSKPVKIFVRLLTGEVKDVYITARTPDNTAEAECMVTVEITQAKQRQAARQAGSNTYTVPAPTPTPTPSPEVSIDPRANEFVNASGDPENHVHHYSINVIAPTTESIGYTEHICTICGHSYTDNYKSKLTPSGAEPTPHVHNYNGVQIPATATESGYTLYICDECGDTYKDNFTPPLGE